MPEAGKKRKRSEDDVVELLQRFSAPTIISLLQEVSEYTRRHSDSAKIDWHLLVKNTLTGINNAREYQMLWRHLAYHNPWLENVEGGAEPLDDDSDLEIEVEAVPPLKPEELAEAKECAKVMLSSGSPRISAPTPRPIAETPNVENDQPLLDAPGKPATWTCGGNSATPVTSQKPPLPTGPSVETSTDGNEPGMPAKKRRQMWTKEEDLALVAAVEKCGEGNWASILKGDFKHKRTAAQLSQRWTVIRKRNNSNPANGNKTTNNATRSEERLAAQKAFSMAVDMPMTGSLSTMFSGATHINSTSTSSASISQASRASAAQSLNQSQDKGIPSLSMKARPILVKRPTIPGKPLGGPNPSIQAAAFAAGGRIANPSTAASLLKAAQSKNAVHIRPGGTSLSIGSKYSTPQPHPGRHLSTLPPPGSFGTTLSSQRSSQPASIPLASCTSLPKLEAGQGPSSLGNAEVKRSVGSSTPSGDVAKLSSEDTGLCKTETVGATKEGKIDQSDSSKTTPVIEREDKLQEEGKIDQSDSSKTTPVIEREDKLQKEAAPDSGSTGKELRESVGAEQPKGVAADEVRNACRPEQTTVTASETVANPQPPAD